MDSDIGSLCTLKRKLQFTNGPKLSSVKASPYRGMGQLRTLNFQTATHVLL